MPLFQIPNHLSMYPSFCAHSYLSLYTSTLVYTIIISAIWIQDEYLREEKKIVVSYTRSQSAEKLIFALFGVIRNQEMLLYAFHMH